MRIAFLCRRPAGGERSLTAQIAALLEEWGTRVELIDVDSPPLDLAAVDPEHDLYVLRTVNEASLSCARALDARGASIVNPYRVSRLCRDKALVTAALRRAGVPVPQTRTVQGAGRLGERRLYCIGGQLFGVQRQCPATTEEHKRGEPFTVTSDLREIALTVGQVIGADLFGVRLVVGQGGPYVVEVNPFPGFKGVPQAALRLADYIYATAANSMAMPAQTGLAS